MVAPDERADADQDQGEQDQHDVAGGRSQRDAAKVFSAIADVNIQMISQGASEINISFVIDEVDVPKVVSRLHQVFFSEVDPEVFA